MHKITWCDEKDFEIPNYLTDFTNYNKLPEPFQEITKDYYFWLLESETYDYEERRQVIDNSNNFFRTVRITWHYSFGLGIMLPVAVISGNYEGSPKTVKFKHQEKYLYFGCDHIFKETNNSRMFEHIYTCQLCGFKKSTDSSG